MKRLLLTILIIPLAGFVLAQNTTKLKSNLTIEKSAPMLYLNGTSAGIDFYNGDVTLQQSSNTLTLGGGNFSLGTNSLLGTGSIGATGTRLLKGWFTDLEITNLPTVNGIAFKTALSLTAADVGLGNVTNESKTTMFTNSALTGTPTVATTINPDANDGATLGTASASWSDLFLASEGVINWSNGTVTLTGGDDILTLAGGDLNVGVNNIELGGALSLTGLDLSQTELAALDGVTGSLNYSTENYGATGTGDIVLNTGPTLTTVNITDLIKLTPTASPPAGATEGMIYMDTDHHLYVHNGTTWVQLDN
jgi:hypothetical protein